VFASVGRRLAVLNAVVVIGVIATVSLGIALFLRIELDQAESNSLQDRADGAAIAWADQISGSAANGAVVSTVTPDPGEAQESEDETDGNQDHEADEALEGGDAVLYGVNSEGAIVVSNRSFSIPGLPNSDSINAALTGKTDERVITIQGEPVRIVSAPVFDASGEVVGAVQAARGQSRHHDELRIALYTSLGGIVLGAIVAPVAGLFLARRAMRPIDAAFETQRAFVADASHELRTPLAVLRANAELIQRLPEDSSVEMKQEAAGMITEIDELTRLVNDLLFLARADELGGKLLEMKPVELNSLIAAEEAAHQNRARAAGLTLTATSSADVVVSGDGDRLKQVFRILLDNAIAYTPSGGAVTIDLTTKGSDAIVRVRDTGVGIPEKDLPHLFDRFYRTDHARDSRTGGSGLGLAIAKAIVDAHHGSISVESRVGEGSTFTVRLPHERPLERRRQSNGAS
jgi:signal transduction histidine kinase